MKITKQTLYLIIIVLAILVVFFYVYENPATVDSLPDNDNDGTPDSIDTDDDNDGYSDTVDFFPFDSDEWADSDGDGTGDNADTDDETDTGDGASWHTSTYTGSGSAGIGEAANSFFSLGVIPPFTTGSGDIQISFTHTWTTSGGCDAGMVWCVHDSDDAQIYHNMEYTPSSGTNTISGHWDGVNNWRVWVGNNCDDPISFSYVISVRWYE